MERRIDFCLAFSHENRFSRLCTHERIDSHVFVKHSQSILLSLVPLIIDSSAFVKHPQSILLSLVPLKIDFALFGAIENRFSLHLNCIENQLSYFVSFFIVFLKKKIIFIFSLAFQVRS